MTTLQNIIKEGREQFDNVFLTYLNEHDHPKTQALCKAFLSSRQTAAYRAGLERAREIVLGKKKLGQKCSCGGTLNESHGLGKVSFPYQCTKCGSYTDDNNELNQTLGDISSALSQELKVK